MPEIFLTFLRLGCLSFGGPVAHLGYFRRELVERRGWCSEERYAQVVALAQTLPGPASSQVGFALGLLRGGLRGGLAAWVGFTAPSALIMLGFALAGDTLAGSRFWLPLTHALQLVAVGVVAQAVVSMQRSLAPDWQRLLIAAVCAAMVLLAPGKAGMTPFAIAAGAALGLIFLRTGGHAASAEKQEEAPIVHRTPLIAAVTFTLLLIASVFVPSGSGPTPLRVANAFYRSGALVFGGGHVVLPILENSVVQPGWVSQRTFLSGYAAAQAVPGPLFTFAAFLGASAAPAAHPLANGLIALVAIFLPGLLLIVAVLPYWTGLARHPVLAPAIRGVHAAVVGVLFAALVRPIVSSSVHSWADGALAAAGFLALWLRVPAWVLVAVYATAAFAGTAGGLF